MRDGWLVIREIYGEWLSLRMSFAVALWLVLLNTFASTPALSVCAQQHAVLGANVADWDAGRIAATPRQSPAEFIRTSLGTPVTAIAPTVRRVPLSGAPPLHRCANPARLFQTAAGRNVPGIAVEISHWFPTDQSHFPYFPTAPPTRA